MPQNSYLGRHRPHATKSRRLRHVGHVVPIALLTATVAGGLVVREAGASELTPAAVGDQKLSNAVAGIGLSADADAVAAATADRADAGASRAGTQRTQRTQAEAAASTVGAQNTAQAQVAQVAQIAQTAAEQADVKAAKATKARAASVRARALRTAERKRANRVAAAHRWVAPVSGYNLTSGFGPRWGKMHSAQDLARPVGGSVRALSSGTVVFAGWDSTGFGNLVRIEYWDGTVSWMAHNSDVIVTVGQRVAPGQVVAHSGNTGHSTGPHVHLEIHPGGGGPVAPLPWLAQRGVRL